jgi:hypothetical protein
VTSLGNENGVIVTTGWFGRNDWNSMAANVVVAHGTNMKSA